MAFGAGVQVRRSAFVYGPACVSISSVLTRLPSIMPQLPLSGWLKSPFTMRLCGAANAGMEMLTKARAVRTEVFIMCLILNRCVSGPKGTEDVEYHRVVAPRVQ